MKEVSRICSVPEYLRGHWPADLELIVRAYKELENRAILLSQRLDFLEELLEEREFCDSVISEYRNKFLSILEDVVHNDKGKGRAVNIKGKKGACRT